jgi:hypothetical protein
MGPDFQRAAERIKAILEQQPSTGLNRSHHAIERAIAAWQVAEQCAGVD